MSKHRIDPVEAIVIGVICIIVVAALCTGPLVLGWV